MTNKKSTKRALLFSCLSLLLCVSMLVGTTFAWFTDEVKSTNNIIKAGNLDVELLWSNDNSSWKNAADEQNPIFSYQYWEPGYTEVKYVKIENAGNLAFKYQMSIIPSIMPAAGEVNLADVIEVYMIPVTENMEEITRQNYASMGNYVGTLSSLMADPDGAAYGIMLPVNGSQNVTLDPEDEHLVHTGSATYCIVLHMQEEAGNEYQNLSVGEGFSVHLLATQYTWENDSFDHEYDAGAEYDAEPGLDVIDTGAKWIKVANAGDWLNQTLDKDIYLATSFQFKPKETLEQAQKSEYRYYHADYVVYADKDIEGGTIALAGFYQAFADYLNRDVWVAMESDETISAGTQIRLVELLGVTVNYEDICKWGNDGTGFLCGIHAAVDQDNKALAAGTTITVELRLYEVPEKGACANGGGCNHPGTECETGEYIVKGTYTFTVPDEIVAPSNP